MPSIATELCRAKEGRQRRRIVRSLVAELASLMHAPGGIPARSEVIAITIPRQIAATLLKSGSLHPGRTYRLELAGGRSVVAGGGAWRAICRGLVSLADAQTAGDDGAAQRAIDRLCGSSWH
jgi:hypothetical protein